MKMFNLNSRLARRATATIALGLLLGAQTAMACTVANWNGGNSGNVTAGGPGADVARYAGICAMETPDATVAWVQDDSPGGIDRIRARFYVLADNSSSAVIYRGFTSTDAALFGVRLSSTSGDVTLFGDGLNATCAGCANAGDWNSIEFDWNAGGNALDLWVNSNAITDPADVSAAFSTANTISSVRLGNLNGAVGNLSFDAYESRRTTEIGRLLACNADPSDEQINILDALAVINEINEVELSAGQPDCDEDGLVTILDALDIINIINS